MHDLKWFKRVSTLFFVGALIQVFRVVSACRCFFFAPLAGCGGSCVAWLREAAKRATNEEEWGGGARWSSGETVGGETRQPPGRGASKSSP